MECKTDCKINVSIIPKNEYEFCYLYFPPRSSLNNVIRNAMHGWINNLFG